MKAVVFRDPATAIEFADVDLDGPKAGEVRVRIAAAGVCHSDLHVKRGEWDAPAPLVMGHEGSGVVTELGDGVTTLAVGDHVVLSWVPPCGECRYCRSGHEARCQKVATVVAPQGTLFDGTSRLSMGGQPLHHYLGVSSFAEEVIVPASGAVKVREDAPLDIIAVVGCAVATGVGAVLNTAAVEPGATVAVIGCGGVGLNVIQGAKLAGAERIVAIDVRDDKTRLATQFGATDRINAAHGDAEEQLRELIPDGVDYAFDAFGHTGTPAPPNRRSGCWVWAGPPSSSGFPRPGPRRRSNRWSSPKPISASSGPITDPCGRRSTSPHWSTATWMASSSSTR